MIAIKRCNSGEELRKYLIAAQNCGANEESNEQVAPARPRCQALQHGTKLRNSDRASTDKRSSTPVAPARSTR